jgi:hypothetical protein
MPPTAPLNPPTRLRVASPRREVRRARFARYGAPTDPPAVTELAADDAALVEELSALIAESAVGIPLLAVREIVENLVHADFEGVSVSVLDGGARVRIADRGPGIPDKARALEPGFSGACDRARALVRGVGSGLPVAAAVMERLGGSLDVDDNIAGGTVVTLTGPASAEDPAAGAVLTDAARQILALLVELAPVTADRIAAELDMPLPACGRELVLLEHRGLVERAPDGTRSLTPAGDDILVSLF